MLQLLLRCAGAFMFSVAIPGTVWARQLSVVDLLTLKVDTVRVMSGEYRVQVPNGLFWYACALVDRGRRKA